MSLRFVGAADRVISGGSEPPSQDDTDVGSVAVGFSQILTVTVVVPSHVAASTSPVSNVSESVSSTVPPSAAEVAVTKVT